MTAYRAPKLYPHHRYGRSFGARKVLQEDGLGSRQCFAPTQRFQRQVRRGKASARIRRRIHIGPSCAEALPAIRSAVTRVFKTPHKSKVIIRSEIWPPPKPPVDST